MKVPSVVRLFQFFKVNEREAKLEDRCGGYTVSNLRSLANGGGYNMTCWCDWHVMGLYLFCDYDDDKFLQFLSELS